MTAEELQRLTLADLRRLCVEANLRDLRSRGRGNLPHDAVRLLDECRRRGLFSLWGETRNEAGEQFVREKKEYDDLEFVRRRTT